MKNRNTYSVTMTESELKLFSEFLEEKNYSKKSKENKEEKDNKKSNLKTGDKISKKIYKSLYTPGYREAMKEAYDEDSMNYEPLARKNAKVNSIVAPVALIGGVALANHLTGGSAEDRSELMKAAIPAAAASSVAGGLGSYYKTRLNGAAVNIARDQSDSYNRSWQRQADLIKVSEGEMSEEEFAEKYYKKKNKK